MRAAFGWRASLGQVRQERYGDVSVGTVGSGKAGAVRMGVLRRGELGFDWYGELRQLRKITWERLYVFRTWSKGAYQYRRVG